ncbi:MAG: 16S rRNA (cytosine(967)-C(5))-methyltransferase RsmB [Gammaproteobacteria bacterium]
MGNGALTRAAAARAVAAVLSRGQTLDAALAASIGGNHAPDLLPRDRAQVQLLAYGAVRNHHRHQALLARLLSRPLKDRDRLLEALLSVGIYQLADPEQPDYAAVSATVEAARLLGLDRAAGLVNASLRRLQREATELTESLRSDRVARFSHPAWLLDRLRSDWPDQWEAIAAAGQQHPPVWLRVNRTRISIDDYAARLSEERGLGVIRNPAFPDALKLESAVPVQELPGFADGLVSVQDAASQLAAPLLAPERGMRVLDACAAPGGKTTHLLERASGDLDLTALDISATRLRSVADSLRRLGFAATLIEGDALAPADWWDGRPFDRILVDAPCSATGVIRRHPDIKLLRRPDDLPALAARQRRLLDRLWPLLKPGGRLLYSTCSVLRAENDSVVQAWVATGAARLLAETPQPGLQLLPGDSDTDGFYYALMTGNNQRTRTG